MNFLLTAPLFIASKMYDVGIALFLIVCITMITIAAYYIYEKFIVVLSKKKIINYNQKIENESIEIA
jgi:hypothetical protein